MLANPTTLRIVFACLFASLLTSVASAHCQVPCGIYGDHARFEAMLEDTTTVAKAIGEIESLAGSHDALGANQLVRWVTTKEEHATRIQRTIADYFMAQRIKADGEGYDKKLKASHAVMVAAMKVKQGADPATANQLKQAILDFHQAYAGVPYEERHAH